MGPQPRYLEGLIDDRDDADDEYSLIRDAVDAVDVYLDCLPQKLRPRNRLCGYRNIRTVR